MPLSRKDRLLADGFELYTVIEVGLPHFNWRVDIDLEHDRNLHLSEETVLRLIDAGITDRATLSQAMGLHEDSMLRNILLNLLQRNALEYDTQEILRLNTIGKRMLLNATVRQTSTVENLKLRHDPYLDELRWHKPEYDLNDQQMRISGRRRLNFVKPIARPQLEERYKEVQRLIEQYGLPKDKTHHIGKREVLRLHAIAPQVIYRPADLEVWFKKETHEFNWRILREGVEEPNVARLLDQLEAEGARIIPSDEVSSIAEVPVKNEILHQATEAIREHGEPKLLRTEGLRRALKQAMEDAQSALFIISPWLRTAAINDEMTAWFERALESKPNLTIAIGYGIERLPSNPRETKDYLQRNALKHLQRISHKYNERLKLTEIGNTHEKIIVCDNKYGIVTSFNFLSFNPALDQGPGVRREIGYRVTNKEDVQDLLKHVLNTLREAEQTVTANR